MKRFCLTGFLLLICTLNLSAAVDQNPLSVGTTQARNVNGKACEAPTNNPALLGVERVPKCGLILPLFNTGIGAWSDKLALSPFNPAIYPVGNFWASSVSKGAALLSRILRRSFDLEGLTPDEVSDKLTEEFAGGLKMYAGAKSTLLSLAWNRIAFDITTHYDEQVNVPDGPLFVLFSRDKGLLKGNTLDFSNFSQDIIWATDFTFHIGLPVNIPVLHDLFKLRFGAGGIGIKYVMGHSILKGNTETGVLSYNENTNSLDVDATMKIQTAGTGYTGPWRSSNIFENGLPVNGHGIGVEIGGILYDENSALTINVQNLGVLFWINKVKEVTYRIKKNGLDVYDIISGIDKANADSTDPLLTIFNRNENEFVSDENDTLKDANGFATILPLSFNIGYSYSLDFAESKPKLRPLADYLNLSVSYQQQFDHGPGRSPIPRFAFGAEAGALYGVLPVRLGYVLGGSERLASAVGVGINIKDHVSLNASYKAVGSPIFIPKRGMELAGGLNINWGTSLDSDKDGICDKFDKCKFEKEDFDGFEDSDGCPDPDNDNDGILDVSDSCPNDAEDFDGFEDSDGCPDLDNDNDGVVDSLDNCPDVPEDRDNFNDSDGCPDYDNDGDGVPDSLDKCPNLPEDIDMFEDEDGCPDYDNDKDGIADTVDNCINIPEVYNGYKDDDGCPDTLVKPTETETKALNTKLRAINFQTGNAELLPNSFAALDYIAEFLKQYPYLRYEIQGHTDSQGEDNFNLLLSAARAGTVRGYLRAKGIPDSSLIAIGYGESMPIADNTTAKGRALNRRVEFKVIETNDEFTALKIRESEFREKINNAKIRGSRY